MIDQKVLGRMANGGFSLFKQRLPGLDSYTESFRPNQIDCKSWLVEEIANTNLQWDNVLVLGSWNGILLYELMSVSCDVTHYTFVDINDDVHMHRDVYFECNNLTKNYTSVTCRADEVSDFADYDLIINTSCEHMSPVPVVHGPTYALQSNDYTAIKEHTNCVKDAKQLQTQYGLTNHFYRGTKKMANYNRFMVIGYYW